MAKDEFDGTVDFSLTTGVVPWHDPGEYVHTITGTAVALTDDASEDEAGKIRCRLACVTEAVNKAENVYDVFDADSATLEAIYAALFDAKGETKDELDIEPAWNNLLFVEDLEVDPEYRETTIAVQLIETAIGVFCSDGLVFAVEDSFDLAIEEWRELGFKRIAGSRFVFRDQLRVNPYNDERE